MNVRRHPLSTGFYYHILNRGVEKRKIFLDATDYNRFLITLSYYRHTDIPVKLSAYLEAKNETRYSYNNKLACSSARNATVLAYCLMPNHFHLLLKQEIEHGISTYLLKVSDSYTKYFNKRYTRVGSLLQGTFKSVLIDDERELMHVSRYIHLNPHTADTSMNISTCLSHPWSSAKYYFSSSQSFVNTTEILSLFKTGKDGYKEFIEQQGGYQRTLAALKSEHISQP